MSGYLERLVERSRTTLGTLRAPAARFEERDLELVEPEGSASKAASPQAADERAVIVEEIVGGGPVVEHPVELRVTPAPPAVAKEPTPRPAQPVEPVAVPVPPAPGPAPAARPPWLRDARIRSTEPRKQPFQRTALPPVPLRLSVTPPANREEAPRAEPRATQPDAHVPRPLPAPAVPEERAVLAQRAEIPPAQVERWERLRERLLVVHPPVAIATSLQVPTTLAEPAKSRPEARATGPAPREIVIRNLEVTVAAPPSHTPAALVPPAKPQAAKASGAWTVAARRYLGRI